MARGRRAMSAHRVGPQVVMRKRRRSAAIRECFCFSPESTSREDVAEQEDGSRRRKLDRFVFSTISSVPGPSLRVNRFHIALLIFVIGASLINGLTAKRSHNALPVAVQPQPPKTYPSGIYDPLGITGQEVQAYQQVLAEHAAVNYTAAIREVVILTIGGVGWFLAPATA